MRSHPACSTTHQQLLFRINMHVLKRIRDKRRSRSHTKSTSELGAAIDYSGSDAYEDSEHPQCATPVTKSPMGAWSPKNNPSVKGALKVITNLSAFDRAGPSAGRVSNDRCLPKRLERSRLDSFRYLLNRPHSNPACQHRLRPHYTRRLVMRPQNNLR